MTEDENEILRELYASRTDPYFGRNLVGYVRPMDLGGRDGSNHSYLLKKLVKKGLVERYDRSLLSSRGSYLYRITEAGCALVEGQA